MANLEVLFTRERYTAMMNYLTYALPTTFSALIHQLTADQVKLYGGIDAPCCALEMCVQAVCLHFPPGFPTPQLQHRERELSYLWRKSSLPMIPGII